MVRKVRAQRLVTRRCAVVLLFVFCFRSAADQIAEFVVMRMPQVVKVKVDPEFTPEALTAVLIANGSRWYG